jgi:hypothetical protein
LAEGPEEEEEEGGWEGSPEVPGRRGETERLPLLSATRRPLDPARPLLEGAVGAESEAAALAGLALTTAGERTRGRAGEGETLPPPLLLPLLLLSPPTPHWPHVLSPHANTSPVAATTTVWPAPHARPASVRPARERIGEGVRTSGGGEEEEEVGAFFAAPPAAAPAGAPPWPQLAPAPHVKTAPVCVRKAVCLSPAATATTLLAMDAMATG